MPTATAQDQSSVTIKLGGGHEAPWIVVKGENLVGIGDQIVEAFGIDMTASIPDDATLADVVAQVSVAAQASYTAARGLNATPVAVETAAAERPSWGGKPRAAAPTGAPTLTCPHGQRVRREGTNARGAWVGWMCPSPKGTPDQCKAIFE